jgi:hypothetical protein
MSTQAAGAAQPAADVKQSQVSDETAEAEAMEAALAAVEGGGDAPADKPTGGDEPKPADPKEGEEKGPKEPASWQAQLRKREKKLADERKAFREEQARSKGQTQTIDERIKAIEAREKELEENPVGVLAKKGLHFDDLARRYLNDGKPSEQEQARRGSEKQVSEVAQLKEQLTEVRDLLKRQGEEKLVGDYKATIKATLSGDEFELLRAYPEAEDEVYAFADKWAARTGQVLQPAEAAGKLQVEWRKQLERLASHKVVRDILAKQAVSGPSQVPQVKGASPKTLTNNLAATPAAGEPDWDCLSEDELIQAALRSAQGE